MMVGDEVSVIT